MHKMRKAGLKPNSANVQAQTQRPKKRRTHRAGYNNERPRTIAWRQRGSSNAIGKLRKYVEVWETATSDPELLQAVKGFGLTFEGEPIQYHPPTPTGGQHTNSTELSEALRAAVEKNLALGIIEVAPGHDQGQWLSKIFVVPKKGSDGKKEYRMILDLKEFNHDHVELVKFKMETLKTVTKLITPGCWFYSLDLKDAYYSIPVHEDLRKYLRFMFEGVLYQYTVMPNGYRDAPILFTGLLRVPLQMIRQELEATIAGYIDDTLGVESGDKEALSHLPRAAADRILSHEISKAIKRLLSSRSNTIRAV